MYNKRMVLGVSWGGPSTLFQFLHLISRRVTCDWDTYLNRAYQLLDREYRCLFRWVVPRAGFSGALLTFVSFYPSLYTIKAPYRWMKISEASQVLKFLRRVTCILSSRVMALVWSLSWLHTTLQTSCLHMDAPTSRLSIQNYLHIPETASTADYLPSSQACRLCTRSGKLSLFHQELSMEDHWDKQEALVCLVSTEATQKDYASRSSSSLCQTLACEPTSYSIHLTFPKSKRMQR
jgi:hypothetical protein